MMNKLFKLFALYLLLITLIASRQLSGTGGMTVFVRMPNGASQAVEVPTDSIVADVISETGASHAVLSFNGARLHPNTLLYEAGIAAETVLHLKNVQTFIPSPHYIISIDDDGNQKVSRTEASVLKIASVSISPSLDLNSDNHEQYVTFEMLNAGYFEFSVDGGCVVAGNIFSEHLEKGEIVTLNAKLSSYADRILFTIQKQGESNKKSTYMWIDQSEEYEDNKIVNFEITIPCPGKEIKLLV